MSDINKIEEILDQHVRPMLQRDRGGLSVVDFKDNVLTIQYKGACGGCPSALRGTLMFIQDVLQREVDSNIQVKVQSV
jgi:NFU1 iron-sulfur cluster scaffold homolog, mitochondrial